MARKGNAIWMDVLPSMGKLSSSIVKEASDAGRKAGQAASKAMTSGMQTKGKSPASSMADEMAAASKRVEKTIKQQTAAIVGARSAEKAATLQVEAAEATLAQRRTSQAAAVAKAAAAEASAVKARTQYGATSQEASAAELALAKAKAQAEGATASSLRAEASLVTTREKAATAGMKTTFVEDQLRAAHNEQKAILEELNRTGTESVKVVDRLAGAYNATKGAADVASRAVSASVDAVKRVGGALGDVVKGGATATIATGATLAGVALTKGFSRLANIDSARAKLDGLGNSAETVDIIMGNALESVRGTAFGLDVAAAAGANAVAAGVKPGEDLQRTLKLVADAATIAGTDMGSMGAIFNKVAASNKIQMDVINQLHDAGVPALALLADQMGVTASEASKMASEGKIDFATFQDAMEAGLGGAALSSGKTFTGALDNVMAALGRIGANVLSGPFSRMAPLFQATSAAMSPLEDAAKVVGETVGNWVNPALERLTGLLENGGIGQLAPMFSSIGAAVGPLAGAFVALGASGLGGLLSSVPILGQMVGPLTALGGPLGIVLGLLGGLVAVSPELRGALGGAFGDFGSTVTSTVVPAAQALLPILSESVTLIGSSLADAIVQSGPGLAELAATVTTGLVAALTTGVPLVTSLVLSLIDLASWASQNMGIVAGLAGAVGGLILTSKGLQAALVVREAGGLLAYAKALPIISGATKVWAAAQWLLNAAMTANPIGLIIAGVAALVAGVVLAYQNVGWFRDGVDAAFAGIKVAVQAVGDAAVWLWEEAIKPAWDGIASGATWLYENAIRPAFDGIGAAIGWVVDLVTTIVSRWIAVFRTVGAIATWLWQNVISPVFKGIAAVVSWGWSVVSAIFDLIVHVVAFVLAPVFRWLYDSVISPVFDWISDKISMFWLGAQIVFNAVVSFFRDTVGGAFMWLWKSVISPVFTWIGALFSTWWNSIVLPLFNGVVDFVRNTLGSAFSWLYVNIVKPVFDNIGSAISWVWVNVISPAFNFLKDAVQKDIPAAFEAGKKAIGTAWDGLKEIAKTPIRFVVDTVINDGIIKNFNKVADFFGSKTIPEIKLPEGFAHGGVLPGYGAAKRDTTLTPMRAGEGVLVPEVVRGLGPSFVHTLNDAGNSGGPRAVRDLVAGRGYATGGVVGDAVSGVIDWVGNAANTASMFIADPAGSMAKVIDHLVAKIPGAGGMLDVAKGMSTKLVDGAVEKIKAVLGALGGGASGPNGQLPVGSLMQVPFANPGPGVGTYGSYLRRDAAAALIAANTAAKAATGQSLSLTEGYRDLAGQQYRWGLYTSGRGNLAARPGTSNHGYGLAADLGASARGWLTKNGPAFGWHPTGLGFSQREPWHFDFKGKAGGLYGTGGVDERPSLYDEGGVLQRGVSLVANNTKAPEYVLPQERLIDIVQRASSEGDTGPLIGELTMVSSGDTREDLNEITHELRKIRRGGRK